MPADLYDCANVILEIRPNAFVTSTIPTSIIMSTALLTGPIVPPSAFSTEISPSAATTAVAIVPVEPQPPLTMFETSTLLVTDCAAGVTDCPVTTRVTSFPVPVGSIFPPSASPPSITPVLTLSPPRDSTSKTTTTVISRVTRTFTSTITSCPPIVTDCPRGYQSFSIYTSTVVSTLYTCKGGCGEGGTPKEGCVQRKRVRLAKRGEL